jgi:hypothetical protein
MAWKLETWNPEYALPERVAAEVELEGQTGLADVKTHFEGAWTAHSPAQLAPDHWPIVYLVDGRQRIDAQIADSQGRRALLATVIAGAVLRDGGGIRPVGEPFRQHFLLHSAELAEPLPLALRHYQPLCTNKSDLAGLRARVTELMRHLEASLINGLQGGLVIVDGQLFPGDRGFKEPGRVLGYTKTQAATYLGPEEQALLHELKPYQRTPVFSIPGRALGRPVDVFSWYLRLPLEPSAPFYGAAALLRVESPTAEPAKAKRLADLSASMLGQMASSPARDPRAPQNLVPTGGLEHWLGRHLGQTEVVRRKIMQALFG